MGELIERVEVLEAPCRECDAAISAMLCGGSVAVEGRYWKPGVRGFCIAPRYTGSVDAAMTLVETPHWMIRNENGGRVATMMDTTGAEFESKAPTPAIALCIAALKARNTA